MLPLVLLASLPPLETGNHWAYRVDSRTATNQFTARTVSGQREVAGILYAVLSESGTERLLRSEEAGRIWEFDGTTERLWLDPSPVPDTAAVLSIMARGLVDNVPAGSFADVVEAQRPGFETETIRFAPGVGITGQAARLMTGSSGGFTRGLSLVYARIRGTTVYSAPDFTLSLSVDQTQVRLAPGEVTNCAVPCYFIACNFLPGAGPPGTFKPCLRSRLTLNNPGRALPASEFRIVLGDESGVILNERQVSIAGIPSGETTLAYPVPLHSPDPLPAGRYAIAAIFDSGHSSTIPIRILP